MMLLAGALLALAAPAAEEVTCAERLRLLAPELRESGYQVVEHERGEVEAAYIEAYGRVVLRYRCAPGLKASIENQGLPTIPFHVLLAAGPDAELADSPDMPAWLPARYEAVKP